jgi:hypothetical protein
MKDAQNNVVKTVAYTYDLFDRRISQVVTDGQGKMGTCYFYIRGTEDLLLGV